MFQKFLKETVGENENSPTNGYSSLEMEDLAVALGKDIDSMSDSEVLEAESTVNKIRSEVFEVLQTNGVLNEITKAKIDSMTGSELVNYYNSVIGG